ncbi:MAG: SDR family oxidoreductase [Pseudomonadota bacterium]|nr:SDR family oxidoreductase [Pseudomonadota bacterium]
MYDFSRKRIFITGGSRGIGKAIAQGYATYGAEIVITYKSKEKLAKELINSLPGQNHSCLELDVTNSEDIKETISKSISILSGLDIVINNAGLFVDHPILDTKFDDWQNAWRSTIEANLMGPANICYHAAQYFKKQKKGKIINISSRGANRGEPISPAYGASKAGLNAMSQSLAVALAPYGIFVGVIAPGFVETDMTSLILSSNQGESIKQQSPLGRVGRPEEIAQAVMMLSMDGMDYATGTIVDLNGASYLRS